MTLQEYLHKRQQQAEAIGAVYTQAALARELGVSRQTLSAWIRGEYGPSPESKAAVASATDGAVRIEDWPCSHCHA